MLFFVVAISLLTVVSALSCEDLVHPRTGVSDCPKRANLCKDPIYREVMTWQCPKTCGFCPATTTSSGTGATSTKPCVDKLNPTTGVSECAAKADLCNNKVYYTLMTDQCPKTCGRCTGTVTTATSTCVDKINPKTGVSDCTKMANYCNNSAFFTLMTEQCPRTCGRC